MAEGLASSDLRQRAAVGQLRRKGNNGDRPSDPLDDALSMRRKMAAMKMVDSALTETDAGAIAAENLRLRAQIDNRQLQEALRGNSGRDNSWQEYLTAQVTELRGALQETQKALTDQQLAGLTERLGMMQSELERVHAHRQENETPTGAAAVRAALSEARDLMEFAAPPRPEVMPPPPTRDPALDAWMVKMNIEQERWRAEHDSTHDLHIRAQTAENELKGRALAIEEEKAKRFDRFITETAPKLIDLGQALLDKLLPGAGAGGAGAVPAAAPAMPQVAPDVAAQRLPEGAQVNVCQNCGKPVVYRAAWGEAICSNCGAEYKLHPGTADEHSQVTERDAPRDDEEEEAAM